MDADKALLLGVISLLAVLTSSLILPYVQFVLAAVVLAFVLQPLDRRLSPRVGPTVSASILLALSVVAFLVPLFAVIAFVVSDLLAFARGIEGQGVAFETFEDPIAEYTGLDVDLQSAIGSSGETIGQWVFGGALSAFETTIHLLVGVGLLLFLLFFLIRDGSRLVGWLKSMSPFPPAVSEELLERTRSITNAVLVGHVLVAIIQGVIAGVGLALAGVPNYLFWTFIMILVGLIPIIGTFVVWAPASVYLVSTDQLAAGIALFVYGTIVVGISDEYLRPIIVDHYAEISPSVVIVGVIGGLSVMGFMGLFVGPIVVGALKETIEVYDEYYGYDVRGFGD